MQNLDARLKAIRKENFDFLFEQFKAKVRQSWPNEPDRGMLKRFGEEAGISQALVSHYNTGAKPIGAPTARKIERNFNLVEGWMDRDRAEAETESLSPLKQEVVSMVVEMLKSGSDAAAAEVMRTIREKMTQKKS